MKSGSNKRKKWHIGLHQNWTFSIRRTLEKKTSVQLEKIFANYPSDKGLVSRIYEKLLQLNKKTKGLSIFWKKIWLINLWKDDIQIEKKIFANRVYNKGFVSRVYEELSKLNSMKTSNPSKRWENHFSRHFTKENEQITSKH